MVHLYYSTILYTPANSLPATGTTTSQNTSGQVKTLDLAENRISNDPNTRQAQLKTITDNSIRQAEEKQIKYTVFGHNFVLREQVSQAAQFIKTVKGLVDEAVKVSPEASLAWAGVCILLPVFTNLSAAEEDNRDGLTYTTSRIRFYVELECLLWPENLKNQGLRDEFECHIVDLYQHILEFQIKTVLRFYQKRLAKAGGDAIRSDDWAGMVSKIKELEQSIQSESNRVNTIASQNRLGDIHRAAEEQGDSLRALLSVAKEQLQVSTQHKDISSQQLDEIRDIKHVLPFQFADLR